MTPLPESVKNVLRAWGRAPSLEQAALALSSQSRGLTPSELELLRQEVAELTVLTLVRALSASGEIVPLAQLSYAQRERLTAWRQDLDRTGVALQLAPAEWHRRIDRALHQARVQLNAHSLG